MTRTRSERKPPARDVYLQDRPSRIAMFLRRVRRTAPQIIFVTLLVAVLGGAVTFFSANLTIAERYFQILVGKPYYITHQPHRYYRCATDIAGGGGKSFGCSTRQPIFSFAIADAQKRPECVAVCLKRHGSAAHARYSAHRA